MKTRREELNERIQAAKGRLEEYKRRGMSDIKINIKQENTVREVKIETLEKRLDKIKDDIEKLSDEGLENFDVTELEIKEAIIKELGKTLPRKPIVPHINISIKKKRCFCGFNMKTNGQEKDEVSGFALELQKMSNTKVCCWIVALIIAMVCSVLVVVFHEIKCIIAGYISALLSCIILSSFSLPPLVNYCRNEKYSCIKRMLGSFGVNFFFMITPILFFDNFHKDLRESFYVQVTSFIVLILLLIIIYCRINKENENGNDLSLLKASNLFFAFIFTAIKLFEEAKNISGLEKFLFELEKIITEVKDISVVEEILKGIKNFLTGGKKFLIEYYFLLPLIGLQGLYELLDRKSKKPTENATKSVTPPEAKRDIKNEEANPS